MYFRQSYLNFAQLVADVFMLFPVNRCIYLFLASRQSSCVYSHLNCQRATTREGGGGGVEVGVWAVVSSFGIIFSIARAMALDYRGQYGLSIWPPVFPNLYGRVGWIAVNRLLLSAVLPGRLYKVHTPCINYHFRKKTQKLLWLCTLSFPLSTPWHLFRMICLFVFFLFPPHPTQFYLGCVCFIRKRPPVFPNLIQETGLDRCKQTTLCRFYPQFAHICA